MKRKLLPRLKEYALRKRLPKLRESAKRKKLRLKDLD